MIEQHLRPQLDRLFFAPAAKLLAKTKVTPTAVTLFSLACGLAVIPLMHFRQPLASVIALWLSGLGDVIDGGLARLTNRITPLGAILDIVSDRIVEFSVVLALFLVDPERALVCIMMLGSILICVTTFLVASAAFKNDGPKSFHYSPGLMERAEAFIFFTLMILFPSSFYFFAWAFVALVCLTASIRFKNYSTVTDLARLRG